MVFIEVRYKTKIRTQILYNLWDVPPEMIRLSREVRRKDIGCYLLFTDGSDWLTRILAVTPKSVITEVGLVKKDDYVTLSTIKCIGTGYSGCQLRDEHLLVRKPTRNEASHVTMFLTNRPHKPLTPREILLALSKMQDKMTLHGINEEWIVNHLIEEADRERNRGVERLEAIKILARIGGQEIDKPAMNALPQGKTPLFLQFNNYEADKPLTIQDKRRNSHITDADYEETSLPNNKFMEKMRDQLEIPAVSDLEAELQKS